MHHIPPDREPPLPGFAALPAPAHWRSADFISDLHLHAGDPATWAAWHAICDGPALPGALFILGDFFEVWAGDDALAHDALAQACVAVLQRLRERGCAVFFMHGNRDFLIGPAFAAASGATLLPDPAVLSFGGQRFLLSHGDALCLGDTDYQRFRAKVRAAAWQQAFLAKPLAERHALARQMRQASQARRPKNQAGAGPDAGVGANAGAAGAGYADIDAPEARRWLQAANATTLIHGHTHRPGTHRLGQDAQGRALQRVALTDWDLRPPPDNPRPRAEIVRLQWPAPGAAAPRLQRLPLAASPAADRPAKI